MTRLNDFIEFSHTYDEGGILSYVNDWIGFVCITGDALYCDNGLSKGHGQNHH